MPTYRCPECGYVQDFQSTACPACGAGLKQETDPGLMITVDVASDAELEIVDGSLKVVTEPRFRPVERSLTDDELAALKKQRDEDLDRLEAVAMKEG